MIVNSVMVCGIVGGLLFGGHGQPKASSPLLAHPKTARANRAFSQADFKVTLDQINALRTEPERAEELLNGFIADAFPVESERQTLLKEKYGEKTLRQHLDEVVQFLNAQPKSEPLQWDADLVTVALNQGKSSNALFTPGHTFTAFDTNPKKALLWTLLRGVDFHYKPIFAPNLRYIGIAVKGSDCLMTFGALKGKAYLMKTAELVGRPYDAREDENPPWNDALSVKQPNITPFVRSDGSLDIVWRDMGAPPKVYLTRCSARGEKVFTKVIQGVSATEYPLLAGFTEDPKGNLYVLRAKDDGDTDGKNQPDPPKNSKGESDPTWDRPEMMRLTKLTGDGTEVWTKNFAKKGGHAFGFISPMSPNHRSEEAGRIAGQDTHASTSRIGYTVHKGTPIIFGIYGAATEWDSAINGRHQNAYWRTLNAETGEPVEGLNGGAMAHSFDNQLLVSDEGVITVERSDSGLLMANYLNTRSYPLIFDFFYPTTTEGNNCFTQLGSIAPASDGYIVVFAGNNNEVLNGTTVKGEAAKAENLRYRNLAVKRIKKGFAQEIDAMADDPGKKKELDAVLNSMVRSPEREALQTTGTSYFTGYDEQSKFSASRPKMVRLKDGNYIVVWERWTHHVSAKKELSGEFDSTWAIKIDENGEILKQPVKLSDTVRITRGDEPVLWNGKATFVTGDVVENRIIVHTVDSDLNYQATSVPSN